MNYISLCANNGIIFNKDKFQFCQDTVDFSGLRITSTNAAPSKSIMSAIENFPPPSDLTSPRSWFGLVNQVAWAYSISPIMQPFRELIKPHNKFFWDDTLNELFELSKKEILSKVKEGVRSFNPNIRTCIQTDWCKHGIGYLLLQKHCTCPSIDNVICCKDGWKLIFAGSRFTLSPESRYSPTDGEALAVSWSLRHSKMFTLGCNNLHISVDHKPLLGIRNDRDLSSIQNPRLQHLKESTCPWSFTISYNPGKWHRGPNAISKSPKTSMINIIKTETTDIDSFICEMRDEQVLTALSLSLDTAGQNIVTLDDCYTTLFIHC